MSGVQFLFYCLLEKFIGHRYCFDREPDPISCFHVSSSPLPYMTSRRYFPQIMMSLAIGCFQALYHEPYGPFQWVRLPSQALYYDCAGNEP
jgi:hypothetical protein